VLLQSHDIQFDQYTHIVIVDEPAEALDTVAVSGAEFFSHTTTELTPRKYAVLRIAPRFCGSVTSSSASTQLIGKAGVGDIS
jgi:hypothetical protein